MKTSYKKPNNKKFFHTNKKIDIKDSSYLKNRIDILNNKKYKRKKKSF
jgi:hypothetical protein